MSFFHPAFDRGTVNVEVVDAVKSFVLNTGAVLCNCPPSDMMGPFFSAMQDAPFLARDRIDAKWSHQDVAAYWAENAATLRITNVLNKISTLAPTEAAVEREFSKLKLIVDDMRRCLLAENVVAACILRSCVRAIRVEERIDHEAGKSTFTKDHASHVIKMWMVINMRQIPQDNRVQTRSATTTCCICKKPLSQHADDFAMKCFVCHASFSPRCAGMHDSLLDRNNPTGRCLECRARKRHTTEAT
jgi:hypothetical protein